MEMSKIVVCRLCLEICEHDFNAVVNSTKKMLSSLLLNLDLSVSQNPVLCNNCLDNLKECFNFKGDYLRSQLTVKHEEVQRKYICCSCMEPINPKTSIVLKNEEKKVTMILEKYFPELVLNGFMDTACTTCYKSLQNQSVFMSSCLATEEKIQEYRKVEGTESNGRVQLSRVLQFMPKSQLQSSFSADTMETDCEETQNESKVELKIEDLIEVGEAGINLIEKEDLDVKMEQNDDTRFNASQAGQKDGVEVHPLTEQITAGATTVFNPETSLLRNSRKGNSSSHVLTRNYPLEITVYKCEKCAFETKHRANLWRHVKLHDPTQSTWDVGAYKCELCTYETNYKLSLQRHAVTHNSPSEVRVYKCEVCPYRGKLKQDLSHHMLMHKHPSEVPAYNCDLCAFVTKRKPSLRRHKFTHLPIEIRMSQAADFHCAMCTFKSKYKQSIAKHVNAHN